MTENDAHDELDRLRRMVRAMGVVNRQLQAQLDAANRQLEPRRPGSDVLVDPERPPPTGSATRRAAAAAEWLDALAPVKDPTRPTIVVGPDGDRYLLESGARRRIRSAAVAAALEPAATPRREVSDDELAAWPEGPPVEMLESDRGAPFVVIGGLRWPVRGVPLPHPVDPADAQKLAEGPTLDLTPARPRRDRDFEGWSATLLAASGDDPCRLVRGTDGAVYVLEGTHRRRVRAAVLAPILESLLGAPTAIDDEALARTSEGPPVEVCETRVGPPFLVLGARRVPLDGFPVPVPVAQPMADAFRDSPAVDAAAVFAIQAREARVGREAARAGSGLGAVTAKAKKLSDKVRR